MSLESMTAELGRRASQNAPLGYKVKFDLGADGIIYWDGTEAAAKVTNDDAEADTVIHLSADDFAKLMTGALDPTMAFMLGKLKVEGKLGVAMKLTTLLGD